MQCQIDVLFMQFDIILTLFIVDWWWGPGCEWTLKAKKTRGFNSFSDKSISIRYNVDF